MGQCDSIEDHWETSYKTRLAVLYIYSFSVDVQPTKRRVDVQPTKRNEWWKWSSTTSGGDTVP
jgi:hypothetical protein